MADDKIRISEAWCSDCRATATRQCWDKHEVLNTKAALRRNLQGALSEAAGLLEGLQDQVKGEQALQALALLSGESWGLTLRGGDHVLTGTVRNADDPLVKALWVVVAARAALVQQRGAAPGPPAAPRPSTGGARPVLRDANAAAISQTEPPDGRAGAILWEIDVSKISQRDSLPKAQAVAEIEKVQGVGRLVGVHCDKDSQFALELLQRAAPTVEQLSMLFPRWGHMEAIGAMPQLRRLQVECAYYGGHLGNRYKDSRQPPAFRPARPRPGHRGLQWLRSTAVPRDPLRSLLEANAHTLEELQLLVSTKESGWWPTSCSDLLYLELDQRSLPALRRVVLLRGWNHTKGGCEQQRAVMRTMLPKTEVLCERCDNLKPQAF